MSEMTTADLPAANTRRQVMGKFENAFKKKYGDKAAAGVMSGKSRRDKKGHAEPDEDEKGGKSDKDADDKKPFPFKKGGK